MAVEIIPAVLAKTNSALRRRLRLAKGLHNIIHLDVMDGHFVSSRSAGLADVRLIVGRTNIHLHAMVATTEALAQAVSVVRPNLVYVHVETGKEFRQMVSWLRRRKISVGVAINPGTPLKTLNRVPPGIRQILVMGVHPGRYHAPYVRSTSTRIRQIKQRWPNRNITCDGGMNAATIPGIIRAGTDRIVIGSALMLNRQPRKTWRRLVELTRSAK